ncbi:MAG: nucleotidyl transferase AbiEii/AbiGii toxin family protein [Gammaproteobacteria bacterium]|nr:nucleotidyl transferase AbiEii/AbiGii toxin family protein [Gammaproteobacteria bacterium]
MIAQFYLDEWRQLQAPWLRLSQIEQDLIISRVLVNLYSNSKVRDSLIFRGGTCLNKLMLDKPARYSEDIDFVQQRPEPIGETLDAIRSVLDEWLGSPKRKLTERSAKLIYSYQSSENLTAKLKIEINTTEHYHMLDYLTIPYKVNSGWFKGEANIVTYQIDELMGSKLRALYQRRKGRDLFDMWLMLEKGMIAIDEVIKVFMAHCQYSKQPITRAMFERNLFGKAENEDFRIEINNLITADTSWDFEKAYSAVLDEIVTQLPGEPWINMPSKTNRNNLI